MTQDTEAEGAPYDIENDYPNTLYVAFVTGHLSAAAALRGLLLRYDECDHAWRREQIRSMLDDVIAAMEGNAQ